MFRLVKHMLLASAAVLFLVPNTAFAQVGSISGTARDSSQAVLPGVLVEVTSPQLIEKVRTAITDGNGRYQIINLPVGTYKVTFKLSSFGTVEQTGIALTTDFNAAVHATMKPGGITDVIEVKGRSSLVDVQNSRQRQVFTGEELRDLPTTRDLASLANLVPGISLESADLGTSRPMICIGGAVQGMVSGGQSGCNPMLGAFNSHSSMNDPWNTSLNRGRIQVDGMNIMGVGSSAFGDRDGPGGTANTPYLADVQNAQEITFTLSGGLGESETGGATINIIPRTGGNRYAGNYFLSYGDRKFYDRNLGTRLRSGGSNALFNTSNQLDYDYDNNGSYGGPVLRDRLWFQAGARYRGRQTILPGTFYNRNEGIFGANYFDDPGRVASSNEIYRNANMRLTLQATQKDKFNIFWDEQYTCSNPCRGTQNLAVSPEAQATRVAYPLHVSQLSWTNPLTNQILLDAGASWNSTHTDNTRNRFLPKYDTIPRIYETGTTANWNDGFTGSSGFSTQGMTSGSINASQGGTAGGGGSSNLSDTDRWETRASVSYVTGSHNAKLGYQGSFLSAKRADHYNAMRMTYNYETPAATCTVGITPPATGTWCGLLMSAPGEPLVANPNTHPDSLTQLVFNGIIFVNQPTCMDAQQRPVCRFPVPASVSMSIPMPRDEKAMGGSLYIQDQWTLNRLTLNAALRYDLATSHYNETCVGPDQFIGSRQFCLNSPDAGAGRNGEGVEFQEFTPRWGVAWDVFGTGRTSVKWNMGRYAGGVSLGGIYTASNAASPGRTVNSLTRSWRDLDGDRIVDCSSLTLPNEMPPAFVTGATIPAEGECLAITGATAYNNYRRFGRSPYDIDGLSGLALGVTNIQCGRIDSTAIDAAIHRYCEDYFSKGGGSLLNGWNRRQYEWQFGLGVQHELLPRMSVEVTYNQRWSKQQTLSDQLGIGCDLYIANANGQYEFGTPDECMQGLHNWTNPSYDYYAVQAPLSPLLPGGGGYLVPGYIDRKPAADGVIPGADVGITNVANQQLTAQVLDIENRRRAVWRGVDVNVTLRAVGGLRLTGGTSTGGSITDDCRAIFDSASSASFILREGRERACNRVRPWQTNLRGTATYTIPWVDVLLSSTFSYRPGTQRSATITIPVQNVIWMPGSESRASLTNAAGVPYTSCVPGTTTAGVACTIPIGQGAGPAPGCSAAVPAGCLTGTGGFSLTTNTSQTVSADLLSDDTFGEGIRLFDIKVAKNVRFGGKRLNVGMDIYNLFNSDAATGYCNTFNPQAGGFYGCSATQPWGTVTSITGARYARFQVQVDF